MSRVIFQPAGNAGGREHYIDTIENPVPIERIAPHVAQQDLAELRALYPEGRVPAWGVTPGATGINESKWNRIERGDTALFLRDGRAVSVGKVTLKLHAPTLARALWGTQSDGQTWEFVYFLDEIRPVEIPYGALNEAAGYSPGNRFMGFAVIDRDPADAVLALLDGGTSDSAAARKAWLVQQSRDSSYADVEGRLYEYPPHIPNGRQIRAGHLLVCHRPQDESEGRPVFGIGLVERVSEGVRHQAVYEWYEPIDPPLGWGEFGGDPRNNKRNAINVMPQQSLDRLLQRLRDRGVTLPIPARIERRRIAERPLESRIPQDHPLLERVQALLADGYSGVILSGPPGTGKTWFAHQIAVHLVDGDRGRLRKVQFHPSYQYEDFVEGIAPRRDGFGFDPVHRHLLQMCDIARTEPDRTCVLLIDEVSRTDAARVFGEALTYIEMDRRGESFSLSSGTTTSIPRNLVFLATMNSFDTGVDEIDAAFERRFARVEIEPSLEGLNVLLQTNNVDAELRGRIERFFSWLLTNAEPMAQVGHAYFVHVRDADSLSRLWRNQLRFVLERAYRLNPEGYREVVAAWERETRISAADAAPASQSENA